VTSSESIGKGMQRFMGKVPPLHISSEAGVAQGSFFSDLILVAGSVPASSTTTMGNLLPVRDDSADSLIFHGTAGEGPGGLTAP
jgi:hypothetical protein